MIISCCRCRALHPAPPPPAGTGLGGFRGDAERWPGGGCEGYMRRVVQVGHGPGGAQPACHADAHGTRVACPVLEHSPCMAHTHALPAGSWHHGRAAQRAALPALR